MEPKIHEIKKQFTNLKAVEKLEKIPTMDIRHYHHFFYRKYSFPIPTKSNLFEVDSTHESIDCEGFRFVTLKNDTCVSDSLRSGILFEKFLLSFVSKFIPVEKDMLDIGANIGVWSIVYSTIMKGSIISFEPQPEIFKCLKANIEINSCKNAICYNVALSNEKTTLKMNASYESQDNFGAFRICDNGTLEIQTEIGDTMDLKNIGFIKMDVEGHELNVLKGLRETLIREKPVLFIEIHMTEPTSNETFLFIKSLGYTKVAKLTHCDYLFIV